MIDANKKIEELEKEMADISALKENSDAALESALAKINVLEEDKRRTNEKISKYRRAFRIVSRKNIIPSKREEGDTTELLKQHKKVSRDQKNTVKQGSELTEKVKEKTSKISELENENIRL